MGIDIPGFIRLLREGDATQALERIRQANPFPAICGRICPAPCEEACVFHADGSAIAIRNLERFAADVGQLKAEKQSSSPKGKKVAIIGSGPAGMSAAYYLARMNFSVTIYDAAHEPGGLLRYAIPELRLPQRVLDEQFAQLKMLGVDIQTDVVFGRTLVIDELLMQGVGAILLATGASLPLFSRIAGNNLSGVYYDKEFLFRLHVVNKEGVLESARQQGIPGPQTVIIGRGPAGFDAARLCRRLGSQVRVILDGVEEEAGVSDDMLRETRDEGIEVLSMKALEIIGDDNGFVKAVKCRELEEEPVVFEARTVVLANGQRPGSFLKHCLPQLKWDADGSLWADEQTGMTSMEKVFGCGSLMTAGGSVVEAIAGGKAAAQKIINYLGKS